MTQEFAAVAGVILPGIFAVENQRQCQRAARVHAFDDNADAPIEVLGGVGGVHAAIDEADQIGKIMISKDAGDFASAETDAQRRVEAIGIRRNPFAVAAKADIQGATENAFIAREPAEAEFGGDGERLVGNRSLRRPQPHGRRSEKPFVIRAGADELLAGIFGVAERGAGQRGSGIGLPRDIRIAKQRQNRMVKRRGGDFDLSGVARAAIFRQDARQKLDLLGAQRLLFRFRKIASFLR